MQTCFFALANVLPREQAIAEIKKYIEKIYGKRGQSILDKNFAAVDAAIGALTEVGVPSEVTSEQSMTTLARVSTAGSDDFVQRVTSMLLAGQGDLLPVSALPVDGTFPTNTACVEKRSIAYEIPIWDPEIAFSVGCALWFARTQPFA
jgi:pyruvate-ferredoxin/flavodoxin oxidoreductase